MDELRHGRRPFRPNGSAGPATARAPRKSGVFQDLGRLARATGALIRDHAILARVEAKQEGKRLAVNASVGAAALPFALTALLMLSVALAVGLSRWLGVGWAFLLVGLLDLAIAGLLATFAALRLREEPSRALALTREELGNDRRMARRVFRKVREPRPEAYLGSHEPPSHARAIPGDGVHPSDFP